MGGFRRDLFHRFNVIQINVPPLRERLEDIRALVDQIMSRLAREMQFTSIPPLDTAAINVLTRYGWPGNVRELRNVLERAAILSNGGAIALTGLQLSIDRGNPNKGWSFTTSYPFGGTLQDVTDQLTKSLLVETLRLCDGNKRKAAQSLGTSRDSLYRYMKKFGMDMGD